MLYLCNDKNFVANMKKRILVIIALALAIAGASFCAGQTSRSKLKEGDMIFHISQSEQSPLIQYATQSTLSHCGIIIEKKDGLYVLEASATLRLTPIDKFINRGKGKLWWAKRVIDEPLKVKYNHLLGRKYDLSFKKDNNRFYCSELLHHIYETQFGISLCEYRKVSSYHLIGLKKHLKRRGISKDQLVVAPADIFKSDNAHNIW